MTAGAAQFPFQMIVPETVIDIDFKHSDTMIFGIRNQLRRGIKPHWLCVQKGA